MESVRALCPLMKPTRRKKRRNLSEATKQELKALAAKRQQAAIVAEAEVPVLAAHWIDSVLARFLPAEVFRGLAITLPVLLWTILAKVSRCRELPLRTQLLR